MSWLLGHQPSQLDLSRCGLLLLCELAKHINQGLILLYEPGDLMSSCLGPQNTLLNYGDRVGLFHTSNGAHLGAAIRINHPDFSAVREVDAAHSSVDRN